MGILMALLALSFLIIVHELGHFTVAKLSGIKVLEFSLFMGPKLFGIQKGETLYSIRLIPLGGYVKMEGEEEESQDKRAFNKKPVRTRAAVIFAGPLMNLIAAVAIFFVVFSVSGYNTNIAGAVVEDSPAYKAGIKAGDQIVKYDGKSVYDSMDMLTFLFVTKGRPVNLEVIRDGQTINTAVAPKVYPQEDRYILGFSPKISEGADSNVVAAISKDSPAAAIGLTIDDRIVRINDREITSRIDVNNYLNSNKNNPVVVTVIRDGREITLGTMVPMLQKIPEQYSLGLELLHVKGGAADTIKQSFVSCYSTTRQMLYSIGWLIKGEVSADNMMGPIGIVGSISEVVDQSPRISVALLQLLNISALISINLGVFNLIPFPALDGSKLLILFIEGIRRKPIPADKEAAISMVGFVILITFMLFTAYNDILRFFTN